MNIIGVVFFLGFVETVILFLFASVSLRSELADNSGEHNCNPRSCFAAFIVTSVTAFAPLKGLFMRKGYFPRTYKTRRIMRLEKVNYQ